MNNDALVLADRPRGGLGPLSDLYPPALIPLAGKAVIDYCLEDLRDAGCRRATIFLREGDEQTRAHLGDGARLGLALRYIDRATVGIAAVLAAARAEAGGALLVARGDMLRGHCARLLLEHAAAGGAGTLLGVSGTRSLGIALLAPTGEAPRGLTWADLRSEHVLDAATPTLDLSAAGYSLLLSLRELHAASRGLLAQQFLGVVPAGRRRTASQAWMAPRVAVSAHATITGPAHIGRHAVIHDDVKIEGCSDLGESCVIDGGAQIIDSVVLPGTYVGRGTRLQNAIAGGGWLFRADLDELQPVDDPLLLDGHSSTLSLGDEMPITAADIPHPGHPLGALQRLGSALRGWLG